MGGTSEKIIEKYKNLEIILLLLVYFTDESKLLILSNTNFKNSLKKILNLSCFRK